MPETVENASNSEETSSGVHGRDTVELMKTLNSLPYEGGVKGGVPHDQSQGLPTLSPAQSFRIPLAQARRIVFDFQGSRITPLPPSLPFARWGRGSLARDVIPSRATKTRVSKPSLQLGQHQLFNGLASAPSDNTLRRPGELDRDRPTHPWYGPGRCRRVRRPRRTGRRRRAGRRRCHKVRR